MAALLCDPGTGKSATVVDYAGILAMKLPEQTARVLVVCPLVAIDTWVGHVERFASPHVGYWSEALGGSIPQRAESLASRGGQPFKKPLTLHSRAETYIPTAWNVRRAMALAVKALDGTEINTNLGPGALEGHGPHINMVVTNIDTFSSRAAVGSKSMGDVIMEAVKRFNPHLIVVDESHLIKGQGSNASKLLGRIGPHVQRRMILTGTVMPHSPMDVFAQWRFLQPYAFGELKNDGSRARATVGGFKSRYAVMGGWMGQEIVRWRNIDEMQKIMAQNAIVVRKEDALDLPKATDIEVPVEMSPAERKAYTDLKDQLATQLADGSTVAVGNRLTQMLRLRQVTSGHLPDVNGTIRTIGQSKVNAVASLVHDTLAGEKRIVIFALFTREIADLTRALQRKGTEVMTITGGTSQADRLAMRERFGSDDPRRIVMVAQIKTMSLAVNELVTASHAIFASMSQQRDDWIQAKDRLNRIGQTKPTTFWHVLVPGTVDTVIMKSHRDRTNLEDAVLAHIQGETRTPLPTLRETKMSDPVG